MGSCWEAAAETANVQAKTQRPILFRFEYAVARKPATIVRSREDCQNQATTADARLQAVVQLGRGCGSVDYAHDEEV